MPALPSNVCRRTGCNRRIKWAVTARGKNIALDPDPDERGTVELAPAADRGLPIASFHRNDPPEPGVDRYMVHVATCPSGHRQRRPAKAGWPKHTVRR